MQDDAGRTGAVPESSAPHTVHEIELAWEGAEVNFKDRLVGALLSRAQQLTLSDAPARCRPLGELAAAERRMRTQCTGIKPAARRGNGGQRTEENNDGRRSVLSLVVCAHHRSGYCTTEQLCTVSRLQYRSVK